MMVGRGEEKHVVESNTKVEKKNDNIRKKPG
jgi:hypothetical protein